MSGRDSTRGRTLVWLAIVAALAGCERGCGAGTDAGTAAGTVASTSTSTSASTSTGGIDFAAAFGGRWAAAGSVNLSVALVAEAAEISGDLALTGELYVGSRRYVAAPGDDAYVAKVKRRGASFVVRDGAGVAKWNVALAPTRIELEQSGGRRYTIDGGAPAWRLSVDGVARFDVALFDVAASAVRVTPVAPSDPRRLEVRGERPSGSWPIVLLDDVPLVERAVLVTELLARGR